jgi:hypothetical protein
MNNLLVPLPAPDSFEQSSSMWVDEAIWGHRLYDEQLPWLVFLEFLNIFHHEMEHGRAFKEPNGMNTLKYRAAHRLYLRSILFNNPHLVQIRFSQNSDADQWNKWFRSMSGSVGLAQPQFEYLKSHFDTFNNFSDIITLIRSTSLEMNSNKRWTSKFVFPYGSDCLFEDLDNSATTNDRRFFGRTGEILYLMLCRAKRKNELLAALEKRFKLLDKTWNLIIKCLQPEDNNFLGGERANAFLPYEEHICFDELALDMLSILQLNVPGFDIFPHIVNLIGFHMLEYQLYVSYQILNRALPLRIVCEMVAPKKTLVREVSCEQYRDNNLLPELAIGAYISNIERSQEWKQALSESNSFERCLKILSETVHWGNDYEGSSDPQILFSSFRLAVEKRHRQHVANIHRNYGRDIGLVSKRGTIRLRYAPTDSLLKTLLFANVNKRLELHQFLGKLQERYGLIFGDKEAEQILDKSDFDKKAFQANSRRLEQRLSSLGLLKRLSDGCAYVINPYYMEVK